MAEILKTLLILCFIGVILYVLRLCRAIHLEKRINKFTIIAHEDIEIPFLDKLINKFNIINHSLAHKLESSQILSKYSLRYNKYISYGVDKQIMDSIRFSIKRLKELNINYLILKELRIMESKEFKQNNYLLYYKRFKLNNMVNYCFKKINDTIFDD